MLCRSRVSRRCATTCASSSSGTADHGMGADDSGDHDDELRAHRAAIDALDREILARLNARAGHAKAIGALKAGQGGPAYRPEREAQVLARLAAENRGPL